VPCCGVSWSEDLGRIYFESRNTVRGVHNLKNQKMINDKTPLTEMNYGEIKQKLKQDLPEILKETQVLNLNSSNLLNAIDGAHLAGIHPATLYTYANNGKIIPVRIGKRVLFKIEDLQKLREEGGNK